MEKLKIKFPTVQEAVGWLNVNKVDSTNLEKKIVSNYDLEVEGMNCLRYKFDAGDYCFAFFKIENGEVADFEIIIINHYAYSCNYNKIVGWFVDVYFEDIMKDFESYLDGRPLKKGENIIRVFENWVISKSYGYNEDVLVRLYEYNILIKEAYDIAKDVKNAVGGRYGLRMKK